MTTWEAPRFEEIRMDAEIGSYQEDTDPLPFVDDAAEPRERDAAE